MNAVRHADARSLEQIGADGIYTALTSDITVVSDISHTISTLVYTCFFAIGCLGFVAYISPYGV
jgi:ABC-type siderophore export system fused ATPase/permease subunit